MTIAGSSRARASSSGSCDVPEHSADGVFTARGWRHRGAATQQSSSGVHGVRHLTQLRGEGGADLLCDGVVAHQIDVERAREQDVPQIDDTQEHGRLALRTRDLGCVEQQVACGLQSLGERCLVAHPFLQGAGPGFTAGGAIQHARA